MNNASDISKATPEEIIGNRVWTKFQSLLSNLAKDGKKPRVCIIGRVDYNNLINHLRTTFQIRKNLEWHETKSEGDMRVLDVRVFSNAYDDFGFIFGE